MLGHLVDLGHAVVHAFDAYTLLVAGQGDTVDETHHLLNRASDLFHRHARLVRKFVAGVRRFDRSINQGLDLACCGGCAARQAAHLGRHHGESASLFTCTGCFYGRIESQDIGLKRNPFNHADDVIDAMGVAFDQAHGMHHLPHHVAASNRHFRYRAHQCIELIGLVGILADGGGEFVHRTGRRVDFRGLLLGTPSQVHIAVGNLTRALGHPLGSQAHITHQTSQPHVDAVDRQQHLADIAAIAHMHLLQQIATGQTLRGLAPLMHRLHNLALHQHIDHQPDKDHAERTKALLLRVRKVPQQPLHNAEHGAIRQRHLPCHRSGQPHVGVVADVQPDKQNADHLARAIARRFVTGQVAFAKHGGVADIGLALQRKAVGRLRPVQRRAHGALPVLLAHRGADPHKIIPHPGKDGGQQTRAIGETIGDGEIEVQGVFAIAQYRNRLAADVHRLSVVQSKATRHGGGKSDGSRSNALRFCFQNEHKF